MTPLEKIRDEFRFIIELDRLKSVERRTYLHDGSRHENSAEHSWHLATAVMVLQHYANEPFDLSRALQMALVHDIVEIDAGDTFVYDVKGNESKAERENLAAKRLFGMMIPETEEKFMELWTSFELQACAESRFVGAIDRFLPMLANYCTAGRAWQQNGVRKEQVMSRNACIADGSAKLWVLALELIEDAAALRYLREE